MAVDHYKPLVLFVLCVFVCVAEGLSRCSQALHKPQPVFQLVRTCVLSNAAILASDRLPTLDSCKGYAVDHKGLALNYVNPKDLEDEDESTCLVFDCPEVDPSLLEATSLYDYYSIYNDIDPESNVTCVPTVGMFQLHREPANFSQAVSWCEWEGGQLARTTSAQRTTHLSALVARLDPSSALHLAYVGMHDSEQEGFFVTIADEPLNCFEYLSWAPGQPRSRRTSEDCVVLDSRSGWRVVDCARKLPFLCELMAIAPDPCARVRNKRFKQKCMAEVELERGRDRKTFHKCRQYSDME